MAKWGKIRSWGRRAPERRASASVNRRRDGLLETIIAYEQVDVLYQPLIDPRSGRIVAAEALARSTIAPSADALFERAAAAGLGERLSRLIQRKALRAAAVWEGPLKALKLSINLLPEDVSRDGFERWLLDEIAAAGMDPCRVTVEITENALLADQNAVATRLARLRDRGVSVAVDDFGTGYSNLGYLATLPLDALKIDRSLIADIVQGKRDRIVVKAAIRLARELDLQIVVEGVETAGQLELLLDWGCDLYQGFLAARPLTHDELLQFVTAAHVEAA